MYGFGVRVCTRLTLYLHREFKRGAPSDASRARFCDTACSVPVHAAGAFPRQAFLLQHRHYSGASNEPPRLGNNLSPLLYRRSIRRASHEGHHSSAALFFVRSRGPMPCHPLVAKTEEERCRILFLIRKDTLPGLSERKTCNTLHLPKNA